jgi:hypothetical protein
MSNYYDVYLTAGKLSLINNVASKRNLKNSLKNIMLKFCRIDFPETAQIKSNQRKLFQFNTFNAN